MGGRGFKDTACDGVDSFHLAGSGTTEKSCENCNKMPGAIKGGGISTSKKNCNCFLRSEITARNAVCCRILRLPTTCYRSLKDYFLDKGCTSFTKIYEPPQSSRHQKVDVKQVPHWGPTNIRRHCKKQSHSSTNAHNMITN